MIKTTRAQRVALKAVYDRMPATTLTYRQFRKRIWPDWSGYGCVMIYWCSMWLGIERDGYTHS